MKQEDFPPEAVPRLQEESINVLSGCARPQGPSVRRTGLVCGYVQSGKTNSIETVSALARDNGYRMIILLGGVTTILVDQSRGRVEHLQKGAGGYDWVMLSNPRARDRDEIDGLVREWRHLPAGSANGRTLFITVMKQATHLGNLSALLGSIRLDGVPALIFDDEADQASLNTRPLDPRPSTIYLRINELRRAVPHHTLLQYTATPQAPLLISRIDSLSADFAEVISPGTLYTGGKTFFRDRRNELVRAIPEDEISDDAPEHPPASLEEALAIFFVGVAAEYVKGNPSGNRSMLIHPHHTKPRHETYLNWVRGLQRDWSDILAVPTEPDRLQILRRFEAAHVDLHRTEPQLPSFAVISERLLEAIRRTVPRVVNSNDGREIHWNNAYAHILVGGEKLGRGYTVKGLTVTYMPRGPGSWNADTIQQRARFFGYHSRYLGLCRLYLHPSVINVYEAYLNHEEDVRSRIAGHRGMPLQELKRAFILDATLRPTRHNVLARLYERPLSTEWFEQRWPHATPGAFTNNQNLVRKFTRSINLESDEKFSQHSFADVSLRDLLEQFLSRFSCPDDRDETSIYGILVALGQLVQQDPQATCRVLFMSHGEQPRYRQQDADYGGINLQQGRSSAGAASYPGDRYFSASDRATLQIHILKVGTGLRGTGKILANEVPALAFRLPEVVRRELQDIIVQPDH